jgi:hypothetical protein
VGGPNLNPSLLYQGTTQRVPHICLVLADVGVRHPTRRFCIRAWFQSCRNER